MSDLTRIFVYGTLKKGFGNHRVLGNSVFIGEAITVDDSFTMFDGGFPYVSDRFTDGNQGRIVGELYETDRQTILDALDRLEGVPHLYVKREIDVTTMDGSTYIAQMYVASEGTNDYLGKKVPMNPHGVHKLLEWS